MTVVVNGQAVDLSDDAVLSDVVAREVATEGRGVAVAVDGEVVPRGDWASTRLHEGQKVEVVGAIQGG
jgi:sulfur carrier protein